MASVCINEIPAAEHLRLRPDPAALFRQDLAGLENRELLTLTASLPASSQTRAMALDLLVGRYRNLVRSCVRRYSRSSVPIEDLMQVGYVGLLKAINNFDPALGFSLGTYARPCINGEIKRHFRDKIWQVRVGRQLQERLLDVRQAEHLLTQKLGRVPTDFEMASDLGIAAADVREARQAELVMQPLSLDAPMRGVPGAASLVDFLGAEDPRLNHILGMQAVASHWGELAPREQQIVVLYYYRGMTQVQIGEHLSITQMQVSRMLARALGYLRPRVLGQPEDEADAAAPPRGRAAPPAPHGPGRGRSKAPSADSDDLPAQARIA